MCSQPTSHRSVRKPMRDCLRRRRDTLRLMGSLRRENGKCGRLQRLGGWRYGKLSCRLIWETPYRLERTPTASPSYCLMTEVVPVLSHTYRRPELPFQERIAWKQASQDGRRVGGLWLKGLESCQTDLPPRAYEHWTPESEVGHVFDCPIRDHSGPRRGLHQAAASLLASSLGSA